GYVLRSARVLGALGYSVEVIEPAQGLSLRGTADDKLFSGDVVRKLFVQMEQQVDVRQPRLCPLRSPAWRSKCASAPRAGPSSTPWMKLKPRREPRRSRRNWWAGTTSMSVSQCYSTPAWVAADGFTFLIRRRSRCL